MFSLLIILVVMVDGDSSCEGNGSGVKMETNKQVGNSMILSLYNTKSIS